MEFTLEDWLIVILTIVVVLGAVWWKFRGDIKFLYTKAEATGRIVNWMSATEEGKNVFYPLIEFETATGKKVVFKADEKCENNPMYPVGAEVKIKYLPSDPEIRKVVYP